MNLVYVNDGAPGFARLRRGKGFVYRQPDGRMLGDADQLDRIRHLAIPPAYTDVWICTLPQGHLQATGRDARGRKQYRYHADWRTARDATKFDRMQAFGAALPRIRARVKRDLADANDSRLSRNALLATLVRLLDTTRVRVGNEEYARSNGSFGLTTLRRRHAAVKGSTIKLAFKGKSGVQREVALDDPRVARIVRRCQAMPGQELFGYEDEAGQVHGVGSADVNDYLREASGAEFTAKDFRTWHGSVHALALCEKRLDAAADEMAASLAAKRKGANEVLAEVAGMLGNTVAVCRKSYVHPRVLAALLADASDAPKATKPPRRSAGLSADERRFMAFLDAA
ncbi:DNA topoisomerase IB [soil metagenome]